ncbi:MAG: hypothetical protein HY082_06480 [Gammaproteobacteria bacterium]|nr:hypothetical protein [Gammaproteobacteria bacterium]
MDCEADGPDDFDLFFPDHETPGTWYRSNFKNRVRRLDQGEMKKRAA